MKNSNYKSSVLINPYSPGIPFRTFVDLDDRMSEYYDEIWDTAISHNKRRTSRYVFELGVKVGFRDIFYAIDLLYENNPKSVIDIGSGNCFWKNWFPNIYAVDHEPQKYIVPDEIASITDVWCRQNYKKFDCGININGARSNHFDFLEDVQSQMNLVNDRFLFTIGGAPNDITEKNIDYFIDNMIYQILDLRDKFEIIMLDVPYIRNNISLKELNIYCHLNGTIRFILEHKSKQYNTQKTV